MKPFTITRTFPATREKLFRAWTDPKQMSRWLAPKGFTTSYRKADIRPGGVAHYSMSGPQGQPMWGKAKYETIESPSRLVYRQYFSDEKEGITRHPMSPTWPLEMTTTVTFKEKAPGSTELTLTWLPENASPAEAETFAKSFDGMTQGWTGSLDQLDAYLRENNS